MARYLQTQWYQSIISITSSILTIEWKNEVITLAQYGESSRAQRVGSLRARWQYIQRQRPLQLCFGRSKSPSA